MKRLLALLLCCGATLASALTLPDDRGRPVNLPKSPQRIVSILPSLTEMVCQLDQCQRLVGVDRYSTWPASIAKLPRVGGGLDPNIEAIVALRPDLVLAGTSSRAASFARQLTARLQLLARVTPGIDGIVAVAHTEGGAPDELVLVDRPLQLAFGLWVLGVVLILYLNRAG